MTARACLAAAWVLVAVMWLLAIATGGGLLLGASALVMTLVTFAATMFVRKLERP